MPRNPRPIRPDDLEIIEQIPGIVGVARDQDLRLFWCTRSFFRVLDVVEQRDELMGTTLDDILTPSASAERARIQREVIKTQRTVSHFQFSADSRVLVTIFPLDREAFGHDGILAVIKDAPVDARLCAESEIPVLSSPNLYELNALSSRELEVLHHIAKSLSTNEIADLLKRSSKTIEKQINSIHTKLNTHSRAELVRYATERGIQSFTDEEWTAIVEGARKVRQERRKNMPPFAHIPTESEE
ncbi:MAG: LuxR C-terminal-related transcriptional regulator [Phycisphaerales bacterium]